MLVHYFRLSGEWVAFRLEGDRVLFDTHGRPLGWMPWGEGEVVRGDGSYLGTVLGNRLVHRTSTRYRCALGKPDLTRIADLPAPPEAARPLAALPGYDELELPGIPVLATSL